MMKTITLHRDDDRPGVTLPARFEVCAACEGEGRVLHPAIRSCAYSPEEFRESYDDEEAAEYMRGGHGRYGVPCETCHGDRVVLVPDTARLTPRQARWLDAYHRIQHEIAADLRAERRLRDMECWAAGERP